MSLHDVDKGTNNRSAPDINADDVLRSKAGRATETNTVLPADTTKEFQVFGRALRIVGEGLISGTIPAVGPGSAGNFEESSETTSVPHDLDFVPAVFAYIYDVPFGPGETTTAPLNFTTMDQLGTAAATWRTINIRTTPSDIELTCSRLLYGVTASGNPLPSSIVTVRYFLLQNYGDGTDA